MILSEIITKMATIILLALIVYWSLTIFLGFNAIIVMKIIQKYGSINNFFDTLSKAWSDFVNALTDAWNNFWKTVTGG